MGYRIARFIVNLIVRMAARIEIHGRERIPDSGGCVIASNHLGRLDPLLVYYYLDRKDIIMLVAEKYHKIALVRWFVKQLDGIWVDRFNADFGAVRQALKRLRKGGALVLAPEGTRSQTGTLQKGHSGVSYLAVKANMPIYPVALTGSEDKVVYAYMRRLRRPKIVIRVGEPFGLQPLEKLGREAALQNHTDEIMCRIAALLPPSYRGEYADHPLLLETLQG